MKKSKCLVFYFWINAIFLPYINGDITRVSVYDLMKCSYGERGSLTATCVNATPTFFKSTLYKFDHLDETVRCVNCTLTTIESNTFDLSGNQIKELDLQNSQIESLKPKAFMGLIFLRSLNMSQNKIRSIFPGTFGGTKKIERLDISKNEISILSEAGFAELIELKHLTLRENKIKVIDLQAFRGLTNLKTLDLSFNQISMLNNSLENMTSLEILNLNHNAIHQLSGLEFYSLLKLNELDISENTLNQFKLSMKPGNQLKKIFLSKNEITSLWFSDSHLDTLEELDLQFNNISVVNSSSLESLYNLHKLQLAYNLLQEIKTGWFSGFPQLKSLNCSHNMIKEVLITGVYTLQNLHSLDLSHNKISDIDYTALISRVPSLVYLRLEDNILPCDLEQEMEKTFEEDNFKYVLYDNVIGSLKCVDKPVAKSKYVRLNDKYIPDNQDAISGVDITIFILISFIITAVGILFYLQYLFYKGVTLGAPRRVASTVQLITSDSS